MNAAAYFFTVWVLLALILSACFFLMDKQWRWTVFWSFVSITLSLLVGALIAWYLHDHR